MGQLFKKAVEAGEMLIQKHGGNLYKGSEGNEYFEYFNQMDYSNIPGAFCTNVIHALWLSYKHGAVLMQKVWEVLLKSAVDSYLMRDGKPVEISSVIFDPKLMNSLAENKDPRLAQTIWVPQKGRFYDYLPTIPNAYKNKISGFDSKSTT